VFRLRILRETVSKKQEPAAIRTGLAE